VHAQDLLYLQAAEAPNYRVVAAQDASGYWSVSRQGFAHTHVIPLLDTEDHYDNGLENDTGTSRRTCLEHCSCQYELCMGGLPCRHRIQLMVIMQVSSFDVSQLKRKWLIVDASGQASALQQLNRVPLQVQQPTLATSSTPKKSNRLDRFRIATVHLRQVADLASSSDADLTLLQQSMPLFLKVMQRLPVSLVSSKVSSSVDEKSHMGALGMFMQTVVFRDDLKSYLNLDILYKFGKLGKGGWYLCRVIGVESTGEVDIPVLLMPRGSSITRSCNFRIYCAADDSHTVAALYEENYNLSPHSDIDSWCLVEEKPLTNVAEGDFVQNPHTKPGSGRRQEKRFRSATEKSTKSS